MFDFVRTAWLFFDEALHNNQGLIINKIYLSPAYATVFYWVMFSFCVAMLIVSILAIYYIISVKTSLIITRYHIVLPVAVLTRKRSKIRLAHIRELKVYKIQAARTLEIYVVGGKKYSLSDVGLKPNDFNEVVWWLSQAVESPH
ncbi:MAG: hypothetical protein Fur0025_12460 [Oscillatoriaceae cyanobacterium]